MKKVIIPVGLLIFLIGSGLIVFKFYEYIFAKTITGVIVNVERVHQENMLITSRTKPVPAEQMFSFAVAIKDANWAELAARNNSLSDLLFYLED